MEWHRFKILVTVCRISGNSNWSDRQFWIVMWGLESELEFSTRTVRDLNHWALCPTWKKCPHLGVEMHAFNSILEGEAAGCLWVRGRHSKFPESQDYIERPCLQTKRKGTKNPNNFQIFIVKVLYMREEVLPQNLEYRKCVEGIQLQHFQSENPEALLTACSECYKCSRGFWATLKVWDINIGTDNLNV